MIGNLKFHSTYVCSSRQLLIFTSLFQLHFIFIRFIVQEEKMAREESSHESKTFLLNSSVSSKLIHFYSVASSRPFTHGHIDQLLMLLMF